MKTRRPQRVYFIKPIGMDGPIKIGCSVSPDRRRETLETWSPFPLEIVAEIDGDPHLERRFHAAFATDWIKHEWFRWSERLAATIARVAAGQFDIAELPSPVSLSKFRGPRDNSIYTPEWRYHSSVRARFRHLGAYPYWSAEFQALVGDDLHGNWLLHRDEIEGLIARMKAQRMVGKAA